MKYYRVIAPLCVFMTKKVNQQNFYQILLYMTDQTPIVRNVTL